MEELAREFCGSATAAQNVSMETFFLELRAKLCQVFRKYLRACQREAVGVIGTMLLNETWQLFPVDFETGDQTEFLFPFAEILKQNDDKDKWVGAGEVGKLLPGFQSYGNPFLVDNMSIEHESGSKSKASSSLSSKNKYDNNKEESNRLDKFDNGNIQQKIRSFVDPYVEKGKCHIATQATMNGLARCTARHLHILKLLPIIADDVFLAISKLYDIYFLTVLRLCAGDATMEKVLLNGESGLSNFNGALANYMPDQRTGGGGGGRASPPTQMQHGRYNGRRVAESSNNSRRFDHKRLSLKRNNPTLEAEICAPFPSERERCSLVREFVKRGQDVMIEDGMINIDKVSEWISGEKSMTEFSDAFGRRFAAAKSCLFAAMLLETACVQARRLLSTRGATFSSTRTGDNRHCSLEVYRRSVVDVIPMLVTLEERIVAVRSLRGQHVVNEIIDVGHGWEDAELGEGSNAYVEDLCNWCTDLWVNIASVPQLLPEKVLDSAWESLVSGAYLLLLEGFSKVLICSTEGRALMSMDLASFSEGVSSQSVLERLGSSDCSAPPNIVNPVRGMQFVDTYVKIFYFGEADVLKWIENNCEFYRLGHLLALITCGVGGRACNSDFQIKRIKEMAETVKALYTGRAESKREPIIMRL